MDAVTLLLTISDGSLLALIYFAISVWLVVANRPKAWDAWQIGMRLEILILEIGFVTMMALFQTVVHDLLRALASGLTGRRF